MKIQALLVVALWGLMPLATAAEPPQRLVVVVVGAPGNDEYAEMFAAWADLWCEGAGEGGAECLVLGREDSPTDDRDQFAQVLADPTRLPTSQLWIVLIGHGTFDGKEAKFNLRGPDVTATEMAGWLEPIEVPTAVINCASSSAPFLTALSGENRIVITATRSGHESNFARLGGYLAEAIGDPTADLDKDEQVSLLEAYLTASRGAAEFYAADARLATEHALLDDNGDKLGTPADWFRGTRATRRAKEGAPLDGLRAHQFHLIPSDRESRLSESQRKGRDDLERQIEQLRDQKQKLGEEEYYGRLEPLLLELARVYETKD